MIARSLTRMAVASRRGFAAAATAPTPQKNPEELRLTFASPNTAYYNNEVVKQVDVPTLAGMVGVLANHVPTIGVLKPGIASITTLDGNIKKLFVSSGTMAMNIDGTCQVLAEEVIEIDDIDQNVARAELEQAQRDAVDGSDLAKAEAAIRIEVADALLKAATGQQ